MRHSCGVVTVPNRSHAAPRCQPGATASLSLLNRRGTLMLAMEVSLERHDRLLTEGSGLMVGWWSPPAGI
jgi:hypothetical protein